MDQAIDVFDEEILHLRQAGEEIVLIEVSRDFFQRLVTARQSAMLDPLSENNAYRDIRVLVSEDAEDYQFHIALDDEGFEWAENPLP